MQELTKVRDIPESEILEQALERGIEDRWVALVLSRCVNDEIDRETAIELVGRDRVKCAERELQAVEDDVRWVSECVISAVADVPRSSTSTQRPGGEVYRISGTRSGQPH